MIRHFPILFIILFLPAISSGQETSYGPGYQQMILNNPALSGIEGIAKLRLSYMNHYPGKNYNLHSVYASADSYFSGIHGGAGIWFSDDYLGGIINDTRGGISYAYFMQAGEDLFINAGLSASFYHRGYSFGKAVLPDQIDPLGGVIFPSGQTLGISGKTVFDIGAGFVFIAGKMSGGLAVNHLAEPDISGSGFLNERLRRKILLHISGDYDLNAESELKIRPVALMELQGSFFSGGTGAVIESRTLSANIMIMANNEEAVDMQTGFSLQTGKIMIFYNYRFNIASGNSLMPFSLLHQTGLTLSLNNVDKRKSIKTINFPKM